MYEGLGTLEESMCGVAGNGSLLPDEAKQRPTRDTRNSLSPTSLRHQRSFVGAESNSCAKVNC